MSTLLTAIAPVWKVLLVGLIFGAGLPAVFALGLKSLSVSTPGAAPSAVGRVGAAVCFLIVALAVVAGIVILAASKHFLARFGLS